MEPLFDLQGRTLCVGQGNPTAALDALLRMNNDRKRWRTPITLYLGVGNDSARALRATEALLRVEIAQLSRQLGLSPGLWQRPRVLSAQQTIQAGLADSLVPTFSPQIALSHQPSRDITPAHEQTQS
jgi:hypothetical protein